MDEFVFMIASRCVFATQIIKTKANFTYTIIRSKKQLSYMVSKGQLISKCLFGIFNSPKNEQKIRLYYYGTFYLKSQIVSICFLGELKTPKRHFEIN